MELLRGTLATFGRRDKLKHVLLSRQKRRVFTGVIIVNGKCTKYRYKILRGRVAERARISPLLINTPIHARKPGQALARCKTTVIECGTWSLTRWDYAPPATLSSPAAR